MSDKTSFWFASIIFDYMPDEVTFVEEWAKSMNSMELSKSTIKAKGNGTIATTTTMPTTTTTIPTSASTLPSHSQSQSVSAVVISNPNVNFDPFDFSDFKK